MIAQCPNCSRANLPDASYCYFDGVALKSAVGPVDPARQTFARPLVFPSGAACKNFDELALGCLKHWREAGEMLQQGTLKVFLAGLGRLDLAAAADEAARFPDRDQGLDQFLSRLPARSLRPPCLEVAPATINAGAIPIGTERRLQITLRNTGQRLLTGTIASDVPWLGVADGAGPAGRHFQCLDSTTVIVQVRGTALRAGLKPQQGKLLIESSGGAREVTVAVEVPVKPFAEALFAGARTPRELAEKAVKAPKAAAPLFESGAVQRWYQSNGWAYPVSGPAATGLGAVQQYFEALGLVKPPRVEVTPARLSVRGKPGEVVQAQLKAATTANRPVYASASSDASWIRIFPALLKGAEAVIPIAVTVPARESSALVRITANGQQRFDIPVNVAVDAGAGPPSLPVAAAVSAQLEVEDELVLVVPVGDDRSVPAARPLAARSEQGWPLGVHLLPTGLLLLLMLLIVAKDALTDAPKQQALVVEEQPDAKQALAAGAPVFTVSIKDDPDEVDTALLKPKIIIIDEPAEGLKGPVKVEIKDEPQEINADAAALEKQPIVRFAYGPNLEWGVTALPSVLLPAPKKLTFDADGGTNATTVSLAGARFPLGDPQRGRIVARGAPLAAGIAPWPGAVQSSLSTYAVGGVDFHQVLEIIPGQPVSVRGQPRRFLDTVLVRYFIHNNGNRLQNAGLRLQLDTLIGSNDGVPFTVPGHDNVISTFKDFSSVRDMPDFVQALEFGNLLSPGTVSHLTIKVGRVEAPARVSLTSWSADRALSTQRPRGSYAWDLPVLPMGGDSAVILYWPEQPIAAGGRRELGFSYGLGSVSANDKLGVTFGGSFEPGQTFTITATVENPVLGQTLRLELPDGLTRAEATEMQNVPPGGLNASSLVSWKARVERAGQFTLKVHSSTGLVQAKTISISQDAGAGKLSLDLQGNFEPGQSFTVLARVQDRVPGETLTLQMPADLDRIEGGAVQPVPAPSAGSSEARVQWTVRVKAPGRHTIRVQSSTGAAVRKTLQIQQPRTVEGNFVLELRGNLEPGRDFDVVALVASPAAGQKLKFETPPGMTLVKGQAAQAIGTSAGSSVRWTARVERTGKFPIRVVSSTGVAQRKTLQIDAPADAAGSFSFEFLGEIRPGKQITIQATVTRPAPNQTLTLVLPKEMELIEGTALARVTPQGERGVVSWPVRVRAGGRLPVRIESSTGLTRAKTVTLTETSAGAIFNQ